MPVLGNCVWTALESLLLLPPQEGTGPRVISAFVEIIFDNSDNRLPVRMDPAGVLLPSVVLSPTASIHWEFSCKQQQSAVTTSSGRAGPVGERPVLEGRGVARCRARHRRFKYVLKVLYVRLCLMVKIKLLLFHMKPGRDTVASCFILRTPREVLSTSLQCSG